MTELVLSGAALKSASAAFDKTPPTKAQLAFEEAYEAMRKNAQFREKHLQHRLSRRYKGRNRLYVVTTIAKSESYGGTRSVGVFDWKAAKKVVEENQMDIFETTYYFVVIEGIMVNSLYGGMSRDVYWYMWQGTSREGKYLPIKTPELWKNVVGFGIG